MISIIAGLALGGIAFFAPEFVALTSFHLSIFGMDLSVIAIRLVFGVLGGGIILRGVLGTVGRSGVGGGLR